MWLIYLFLFPKMAKKFPRSHNFSMFGFSVSEKRFTSREILPQK
jgi:hypothetical protein